MKKKLTIKELAPYLPYGLKGRVDKETYLQEENERIGELKTIDLADHSYDLAVYGELGYFLCYISDFKPLLRPLSSLTEEIEHNGEKFVPKDKIPNYTKVDENGTLYILVDGTQWQSDPLRWDYETVNWLISLHFDVFGLHEKGLCIYYNEI